MKENRRAPHAASGRKKSVIEAITPDKYSFSDDEVDDLKGRLVFAGTPSVVTAARDIARE